jgi:hypothetical protein
LIRPGDDLSIVEINWVANPFRGDKFQEAWAPAAEAVVHYGARAWAFMRSKDDPLQFTQLAVFDAKIDFERYWYSEETAEARVKASGLYQVPILPIWHRSVSFGAIADEIPNEVPNEEAA